MSGKAEEKNACGALAHSPQSVVSFSPGKHSIRPQCVLSAFTAGRGMPGGEKEGITRRLKSWPPGSARPGCEWPPAADHLCGLRHVSVRLSSLFSDWDATGLCFMKGGVRGRLCTHPLARFPPLKSPSRNATYYHVLFSKYKHATRTSHCYH